MFTGLIQDVGTVRGVTPEGQSVHIQVQTTLTPQLELGDSLAVNGVCLTVTRNSGDIAVATAVPETLARTTLGKLGPGSRVNLEPALRVQDRLGGHIVQGHVDGVGTMVKRAQRGLSLELTFSAGPELLRYMAHKGSITVDGVSLTVADLDGGAFTVALVPHTLGATTLEDRAVGDRVNLEVDILAKYVEKMLGLARGEGEPAQKGSGMSEAWLRERGFG